MNNTKKSASMARSANILTIIRRTIAKYAFEQSIIQILTNSSRYRHYSIIQQIHSNSQTMYARESERGVEIYNILFNCLPAIQLDREQGYVDNYIIRLSNEAELNLPSSKKNSN